jgi:PKD repeat protein
LASGSSFPIGVTTNTFEATDAAGNTDQCSFTVTVISPDTVIAGFNFSVSALGVTFTNTSQDATSYVWDFGDGNGSSSTNPSHNYASGGNYTVQLIAIGACESDTITQLVSVAATSHIWTGLVDSSWGNPGNWSNNVVPSTSCTEIDVVIPSGTPNDPVVDGHYNINNLTVQAGARLTVNQNDTLELCGNITHNGLPVTGLGLIKASSTVNPQTISGTFRIGILEIFNPQGVSLVGNSSVGVRIALNMMQGDLAIPPTSSLVLESRASGTAYLDDFTSLTAGSVTNGSGGNGEVTVERFVTNPVNAFHFISAAVSPASVSGWSDDFTIYGTNNAQVVPLPNCDPNNLAPGSPYGGLFEYREDAVNTCELEGWHVRSSGSLDQGEGYAGIISNGTRIELVGEPGTGNISFGPLTRTSTNTTAGQGWNMLGNPYPSALNWPDVAAANPALGATGYLWQSSGYYGGTLQPLSALIPSDNIASSQSFEVEVLGPAPQSVTVNFNNSMRRTGDPTFQRSVGNYDQRIDLVVEANGFADKTHVVFLNGPTNGWDGNYDGRKRASLAGQPTLFSYIGNEMMSINARPEFDQNGASVPVGLIAGANGSFDIRLDVLEGFPFSTLVLLEDKQLGIFHNLIDQQTYSFTGNVNDAHDRFVLHFTPPVEVSATAESCDGNDGELDVDLGQFGQGGWTFAWDSAVISGNGQHLVNMNVNGSLNTASLSPGAYSIEFHYNGFMIDTVIMVDDLSQVDAGFVADKVLLQVGEMITLTDASVGASTLQWSFGDGNQAGNQSVVTHSYATDGLYTIRQDASNQDCSADTSIQVEVLKNSTGIAVLDGVKFHITSEPGYLIVNIHGEVSENVGVTVHDLKGAHVIDEEIEGSERIPWDFAQGYYLVRLTYKSRSHSQQVLLR